MSSLVLCQLGKFQLTHDKVSVILDQARLPELLAYIVLHRHKPIPRQSLAFLLWPDSTEGQALTNLRNLLFKLRVAWPRSEEFLDVSRTEIRWKGEQPHQIDVVDFEAALAESARQTNPQQKEAALRRALSLYKGELLPDLYEDWVLKERERLHALFLQAVEQLVLLLEEGRRYDEAIAEAQRLIQADPLQETSHRHLMRLHAAKGDRAAALRAYHTCASILEHELGVQPSAATQEIHDRLLNLESATPATQLALAPPSPLVGRLSEWKQLLAAWQDAQKGRSRLVFISGEAGIGKTRLAEELVDLVAHQGYTLASSRAYAAEGALSYAPVSEWLRRQPIRRCVEQVEPIWQVEIARLLPELLHEYPDLPSPGPLREGWQKQRFFEGLARLFLAAPQPALLHLDDLQWCDEETLTFLHYLLRSARQVQLLMVGTARNEEINTNRALSRLLAMLRQDDLLLEIELGPLSAAETAALAAQTSGEAIPTEIQDDLYKKSEGHPLFLIEMIRMSDTARETQAADGSEPALSSPPHLVASSLPPKIQAVIGARLGQLSSHARELAQLAAVIGREFNFPLLMAASSADEEPLVMALDELWQRRIVREQADGYDFSHDRIREVAYAEISQVRRRFLHRRVASALESLYAGEIAAVYAQIAVHYQEAGEKERAQHYHRRAAEYAMDRFVAEEALRHLLAALDLTPIDDTATARDLAHKRMEEHFDLLVMLQKVYTWQARLVEWDLTLEKMEALAHTMDDDRRRAQSAVYRAEWFYKHGRAEERCDKAKEAIALAERARIPELIAAGYIQWGLSRYDISRFSEARPLLQKGAALAHQAGLPNEEGRALEMLAALGMFSGMSAAEIQHILKRCWEIANRQKDVPFMAAICNKFGYVIVAQGEGQYDEARHQYELCIQYSRSVGDVVHEAQCLLNLIVLETIQGNYAGSMNRIRTYLALPQGTMTPENRGRYLNYWGDFLINVGMFEFAHRQQLESLNLLTHHGHRHFAVKTLVQLAWLQHLMGDDEAALASSGKALEIVTGTGDTRYRSIALTRQGYALHKLGDLSAAADVFRQAHASYQQMEQFKYSLNPLAGLARIAVDQGDTAQAGRIAHQIYTYLQSHQLDRTIEGCRVYLTAYRILKAVDDPRARWVLQTAWTHLQQRAATIDDPKWLHSFWQVADHQAVVDGLSAAVFSGPSTSNI